MNEKNILEDEKLWDFHQLENRDSFNLAAPRFRFLVKQITGLKRSNKILDIGFGDGQLLQLLSHYHFDLYGTDISKKNVKKTKNEFVAKKIDVELKVAKITDIPFEDNEFDVVVATEVLEHAGEMELQEGLQEIRRVLKTGGFFFGTVPANENLSDSTCFCSKCENVFHRWGHKQSFNEGKIKTIFIDQGFQIKNIKHLAFFGEQLIENKLTSRIKFQIRKILFKLVKKIFAPQWWFFFEVKKFQ